MSAEYRTGRGRRIVRGIGLVIAPPVAIGLISCSSSKPDTGASTSPSRTVAAAPSATRTEKATPNPSMSSSPQPTEGQESLPAYVKTTVSATCGLNPSAASKIGAPFDLTPATGINVNTKKDSFSIATTNADRPTEPVEVTTSIGKREVGGQGQSVVIVFYNGGRGTLSAAPDRAKPVRAEHLDWTLWTACGIGGRGSAEAAANSRAADLEAKGLGPAVIEEIGPNGKITP